jgi:hypothetical protein
MDPGRLVSNASGWTDKGCGDISDMHMYPGPGCPNVETTRAAVLGEYGGLGLPVQNHTWSQKAWGYQGASGKDDLTRRYERLLARTWELKDNPGMSAAVYTQLTDVETECNGLYTYDREQLKLAPERLKAATLGRGPSFQIETVVPTAEREPVVWRYTFETPKEGWEEPGFDDSAWKQGAAGFGTHGTPGSVVRTEWSGKSVWMRREFVLPKTDLSKLCLLIHHDETVDVYLNGVRALHEIGYTTAYGDAPISQEAKLALKPGEKNVVAVRCQQEDGGQYIDLGLVSVDAPALPAR